MSDRPAAIALPPSFLGGFSSGRRKCEARKHGRFLVCTPSKNLHHNLNVSENLHNNLNVSGIFRGAVFDKKFIGVIMFLSGLFTFVVLGQVFFWGVWGDVFAV